jgi:tRNA/rRNA methyltransferase
LHGVILAIAEGRKGPARGGILNGEEAEILRALLAGRSDDLEPRPHGAVRGLARLLRRNPTDAERALWSALTNDRRFAGRGFKRQVPIGPHINDFVSFALRLVIEMVPEDESAPAAQARAQRTAWLEERGYRIIVLPIRRIEANISEALDWIAAQVDAAGLPAKT